MKLHIGIDDTDSTKGGCTTYVGALLVEQYSKMRIHFTDYPNIIRLNPNIPYKTRGNAAVAIRLDVPNSEYDAVREIAARTIENSSQIGQDGTDPAVVLLRGNPSRKVGELSWKAVTGIVTVKEAVTTLRDSAGSALSYGSGLGLVGALAAAGSRLAGDHTYELVAYRRRQNVGKPRLVDEASIIEMDRLTRPSTFNNYDTKNKRVLIKPHGPDPVLLGLRGETPEAVSDAFRLLRINEPIERWVIFRTNHGTEAHFQATNKHSSLRLNHPVKLQGVVYRKPRRIPGGHVLLEIQVSRQLVHCAAFEPTGTFKETVAKLIPGDKVTVFGGVREREVNHQASVTVNLEKIIIQYLNDDVIAENPRCPRCGKRMKSAGRGQGFRCRKCKCSWPEASKRFLPRNRNILRGLYLPDRKAQRHLTKPFSRYGIEKRRWNGRPPTGTWHWP